MRRRGPTYGHITNDATRWQWAASLILQSLYKAVWAPEAAWRDGDKYLDLCPLSKPGLLVRNQLHDWQVSAFLFNLLKPSSNFTYHQV
jgi:hypothetical protein